MHQLWNERICPQQRVLSYPLQSFKSTTRFENKGGIPEELDHYFDLEPTKMENQPQDFFDKVIAKLKDPIHDDGLRGNLTGSGNSKPFFDFVENEKDQSRVLSPDCVAQKSLLQNI